MRIAFVEQKLNLVTGGGSNHSLNQMASGLAELGHQVSVITTAPSLNALPPDLPYEVVDAGLPGSSLGFRQKLALLSLIRELEDRTDIFQIESPSLLLSAALYRRLGGKVPVVGRLHNYTFFCTNPAVMDSDCYRHCSLLDRIRHRREPLGRKLVGAPLHLVESCVGRLLINGVDRFIAMSPAVAEIHSWYGMDPSKMVIVPSALEHGALFGKERSIGVDVRKPGQPFRLLYAGRLARAKGVDILLRATAELDFSFTLDIVGDGPAKGELQELSSRLGLASSVRFRGWAQQDAVRSFYLSAQLFVHPGRWPEPAARTVMDAMALGVPLVVSRLGGPPWMAGEAALTFSPEDHADLAAKIAAIYREPKLAVALASTGRRLAQRFDRQRILAQLLDLYTSLCPEPRALSLGSVAK